MKRLSAYDEGYEDATDLCIDEIKQLEQEVKELKEDREDALEIKTNLVHTVELMHKEREKIKAKADAWDDLEALVEVCQNKYVTISISPMGDFEIHSQSYICPLVQDKFSKEAVSNALESIKGED